MRITLRPTLLPGLGAALAALVTLTAVALAGPVALAVAVVAFGAALLFARPALAAGVAIGTTVVIESQESWGPSAVPARIYDLLPGTKISGIEALLLLALVAAVLGRRARGLPILIPGPFSAPLALLGLGMVVGIWTARNSGVGASGILDDSRAAILLLVVPFIVVQVVDGRQGLRVALGLAAALAAYKGVAGVLVYFGGGAASPDGEKLTYYASPANTLTMFFLCFGLAAVLTRQHLPRWVWWAMPFALLSLTLSYRRSFWIAAVLGLGLVLLVAASQNSRRFGLPAVFLVAVAVYLSLAGGGQLAGAPADSGGGALSLGSRVTSLNPTAISSDRQDRYRIGERRNVLAELEQRPLSGLGFGVGYAARYPLSVGDISHTYVHFAALWWWMKLGILGLIGYVWLLGATVVAGAAVWRRHPDGIVRAAGLAAAAGVVGYAVAEVTATFSGADLRSSVLLGALLGLLSVARSQTPPAREVR